MAVLAVKNLKAENLKKIFRENNISADIIMEMEIEDGIRPVIIKGRKYNLIYMFQIIDIAQKEHIGKMLKKKSRVFEWY